MSEVNLFLHGYEDTISYALPWSSRSSVINASIITGLELQGRPSLESLRPFNPLRRLLGRCLEVRVALPVTTAEGVYDFYRDYQIRNDPGFFDCHTAVEYIKNWKRPIDEEGMNTPDYDLVASSVDHMVSGEAYELGDGDEYFRHAVIATERPDASLSVLGARGALILASTTNLMEVYGASEVWRLAPAAKSA